MVVYEYNKGNAVESFGDLFIADEDIVYLELSSKELEDIRVGLCSILGNSIYGSDETGTARVEQLVECLDGVSV